MAAAAPRPWLSGFCNPANPDSIHARCADHPRADGVPCTCLRPGCHNAPAPALTVVPDAPGFDLLLGHIRTLAGAATRLNEDLMGLPITPHEGVQLLALLRKTIQSLRLSDSSIETFLTQHRREVQDRAYEGIGYLQVDQPKNRTGWQHQSLLRHVIETRTEEWCADHGGEVPDPFTVGEWINEAAGGFSWRVTALRAIGIEPDGEFCDAEPGRAVVKIT